jgi:PAS domain S-box-containing protein
LPTAELPIAIGNPDVAERKFERLYRMLLDSIPSSVLLVDSQLRVVSVNSNFLRKSRVQKWEVLNQPLEKAFPPVMYEHMNLRESVTRVFRSRQPVEGGRLTYRTPGMPTRTYYYCLVPFHWEETVEHVMLLMDDVTEQVRLGREVRRAEHHLASVVESAAELVVSTDLNRCVLTWNSAAEQIVGYPERSVYQRDLCDLCQESDRGSLKQTFRKVQLERSSGEVEAGLVNRNGNVIPVYWVCSPMLDEDRNVAGFVAVGRDLTERRQLEMQLLRSEKLAALGVMAGGIAHEIRTPLGYASLGAQLLLDDTLSHEDKRECAERVHRGIERASRIIESLLRFARPSPSDAFESVDLVSVTEEALSLVASQLRIDHVCLNKHYRCTSLPVHGNAGLLQQVVTNLVLNSSNAMPETGGEINIRLERTETHAILVVQDSGRGIASDALTRVFDPFFTTMPMGKGTGLGLSLCYSIVKQHRGTIDIESHPTTGTTVTVRLPAD